MSDKSRHVGIAHIRLPELPIAMLSCPNGISKKKNHKKPCCVIVKRLQYRHQRDRTKCSLYRGVRIIEVAEYDWGNWFIHNGLNVTCLCFYIQGYNFKIDL